MKHLLGEASAGEKQAVNEWMNENSENRQYYNQLKKIWDSSKELAVESTVDVDRAWERFQGRVVKDEPAANTIKSKGFSWMKVAASIILIAGAGIATYFIATKEAEPKEMFAQTQQNVLIDTLSDGSVVTLNKRSTITYPSKFKGSKRAVALKGEAFFNVAPNKEKPFVISVNDVEVTVVGTSFNIKSENGNTEVIVETGTVRVTKAGKTVELVAGEKIMLSANDSSAAKEPVTDKLYNYYRSKVFVCDNTPLWKLVQVINEAYDAKISIGRKELYNMPLTAPFNNESLDQVLEIIHLTLEIDVVKKDNGEIILQ